MKTKFLIFKLRIIKQIVLLVSIKHMVFLSFLFLGNEQFKCSPEVSRGSKTEKPPICFRTKLKTDYKGTT